MNRIAPQSGVAFSLAAGETLRIVDPFGEQVADVMAFAQGDPNEWLSSGRSLDYAATVYLTAGHTLYSNQSHPMFEIVADTVGRHDFLLTPCSRDTFRIIYGKEEPHASCAANLAGALAAYVPVESAIPTTFNAFMNVEIGADGALSVLPPRSRAGDRIELLAKMDLVVGLTACSAEMSNNYAFKPIDWEILPAALL